MLKYSCNIIFSSQKAAVFKNVLLIVHMDETLLLQQPRWT